MFAIAGVACIFGGEALCLLGPLKYERQVHLVCHVILYGGMVLIGATVLLRLGMIGRRPTSAKANQQS